MIKISDRTFLIIISLFIAAAMAASAYIYLLHKNYDFTIEAPCDPAKNTCYHRDCSAGDCPPNGLEYYRVFTVNATDYSKCSDQSCLVECSNRTIACTETLCGASEEDECAKNE